MKILILGAGAIGSVFGGLLSKSGHDVLLVGRASHISSINKKGLFIDGIWGEHIIRDIKGVSNINEIPVDSVCKFDVVLISVKSYDTKFAINELVKHFKYIPPVVSLQNGLGNLEIIEALAGKEKTIGARVIFGVEFVEPGRVKVTVSADKTVIGGLYGSVDELFLQKFADALTRAGIITDVTHDINRFIWGKVLYNCALNGLATIIDVNYGKLLSSESTREIMSNIIEEIFLVAGKKKINLDWETPSEYKNLLFYELIPKTFEHHPSMLQDIKRGKKTEIDALNGAVVKIGEEIGLQLPCNRIITELIKAIQMKNMQS